MPRHPAWHGAGDLPQPPQLEMTALQTPPSLHIQAALGPATSTLNCPELVPSLRLPVAPRLSLPLTSLPSPCGCLSHRRGSHCPGFRPPGPGGFAKALELKRPGAWAILQPIRKSFRRLPKCDPWTYSSGAMSLSRGQTLSRPQSCSFSVCTLTRLPGDS